MRSAQISRRTAETDITLRLNLDDASDGGDIATGVGFLDHMLILFAGHSRFGLSLRCEGDTFIDDHHSVEDIGICLGQAFAAALGEKRGITRYGSVILPMDEALILAAVDISGRGLLRWGLDIPTEKVGAFDTELVQEFWTAFARCAGVTVHLRRLDGENSHHIIEGAFKAMARALRTAAAVDPSLDGAVPSTKGSL